MEGLKKEVGSRTEELDRVELFDRLKETGAQINSALLRSIPLAGLLLAAAPIVEKSTYGYEVTSETDEDGNRRWKHEDQETQQLVDFMAGLGPAPERFTLMVYKQEILRRLTSMSINEPEGWDTFTKEDVERFWISEISKQDTRKMPVDILEGHLKRDSDYLMSWVTNSFSRPASFSGQNTHPVNHGEEFEGSSIETKDNDVLYEKLWQLMEKCGGPKIRSLEEGGNDHYIEEGRAYYQAATHTMYIDIKGRGTINDNFAAEMAHACQYHLSPFESNNQKTSDLISAGIYAIRDMIGFRNAYDELLYEKEGSIEYEAHKEIEPRIKAFLDSQSTKVTFNM